ncbi:hypothetical protein VP01_2719g2 [Puccinia sorghi]|uniref:Uncharacterized protein n=1 Tax=Puccinia sorghi TaxID=27349 RepID=A0A0L6V3G8_9BASI|nr:hypothetical protein VP01_2719g2 [Puccinia sorghi]
MAPSDLDSSSSSKVPEFIVSLQLLRLGWQKVPQKLKKVKLGVPKKGIKSVECLNLICNFKFQLHLMSHTLQKILAQLPAVDMQKVPGSFCCLSPHSPTVIQPSFDAQSLCSLPSDCAKTSTYEKMWSLDGVFAGACCMVQKLVAELINILSCSQPNVNLVGPSTKREAQRWKLSRAMAIGSLVEIQKFQSQRRCYETTKMKRNYFWCGAKGVMVVLSERYKESLRGKFNVLFLNILCKNFIGSMSHVKLNVFIEFHVLSNSAAFDSKLSLITATQILVTSFPPRIFPPYLRTNSSKFETPNHIILEGKFPLSVNQLLISPLLTL